jgi:membrane fusion protein, copper/silver efflux system
MKLKIQRALLLGGCLVAIVLVVAAVGCGGASQQVEYRCPMHPEVVSTRPGDCPVCGMKLVAKQHASAAKEPTHATQALYVCPMDPEVTSDHPGKCPKCGMELVAKQPPAPAKEGEGVHRAVYTCPMDPEVTSNQPGTCPKCGMKLVLRAGSKGVETEPAVPEGLAPMTLPASKRELLGLTVGDAAPHRFIRHIRAAARIVPDESRLFRVTAPVAGWVDRLFVEGVGDAVRKGEPLAKLYNVEALNELRRDLYLLGRDNPAQQPDGPTVLARRVDPSLLSYELIQQRVRRWGLADEQIKSYSAFPGDLKELVMFATSSGLVAEKSVIPGQSVQAGDQLFVVADLSRVWAEVDLLASDAPLLKSGMAVEVEAPALPGRTFPGRLATLAPFLDSQTRTQRVRLELDNPGAVLRPGLPAVATLAIDLGERLAVPSCSVLRTGDRTYAFRLADGDRIVPVVLRTGITDGDFVEVLGGLAPGSRVITSATFLIDSESAMAAALQAVSER